MKRILLITLSLFIWSCEKDKDDTPSYSACEFGGEQTFVSSFPFSDNGSTENLENNFYDDDEDEWENWEYYYDYYYEYYGEEWDVEPPTGADYAYHFTLVDTSVTNVVIDLCGSYENYAYDTYLYLFEFDADSCDYINLLDENDDRDGFANCVGEDGLDSYLNVFLPHGDYYAVVGGYYGREGEYDISITIQDSTDVFSFINSDIKSKKVKVTNNKFKEIIKALRSE